MSETFEIFNGKLKLKKGPGCYKVTEDSLWLLSLLPLDKKSYLEVGCATGVISLLLKLKNQNAEIKAIDIQEEMIQQADDHKALNNISGIDFTRLDLFEYTNQTYDCVFSNPPFYNSCSCHSIKDHSRSQALIQCDMAAFVDKMLSLVKEGGCLCFMGHTTTRDVILNSLKDKHSLIELELVSKKDKQGKRFIYILQKDKQSKFESKKINAYDQSLRLDILNNCNSMKF